MASPPPELTPSRARERQRWLVLNLVRLFGFGFAVLGILMTQDAVDLAGASNRALGYAFIVIGLADGFVVPQVLARKWRSPHE